MSLGLVLLEEKLFTQKQTPQNDAIMSADIKSIAMATAIARYYPKQALDPLGLNISCQSGQNPCMGIRCQTPANFMPATAKAAFIYGTNNYILPTRSQQAITHSTGIDWV